MYTKIQKKAITQPYIHDHLKSEINKQITLNILFPSVCRNCCITSSTELQLKANHQCTLIYWEILRCSYCLICTILGTRPTRHFGIVVFLILYFNLITRLLILFCSRFWSSENISTYNKYAYFIATLKINLASSLTNQVEFLSWF